VRGKFVGYYRVSTQEQGKIGLGLEAQQRAVRGFLDGGKWELVAEFTEVESGKRDDRPELAKAIAACKKHRAAHLAKLDRLSRDVAFIATLMKGVDFLAADDRVRARRHLEAHEGSSATTSASQRPSARRLPLALKAFNRAIASTMHLSALAAAADLSKRNITTATGARWCAMQVISDPRSQAPRPDPLSRGAG
jgi:DNA invertase Pin-like site-specific DNA recombinase